MASETMTRKRMLAVQSVPKRPVRRFHSCTCGDAPGTKPEDRTTQPLIRGPKPDTYLCARCGRES